MDWINGIAKHHNEWVTIVKGFGEQLYYEDIVQEMYLRVYKYKTKEQIYQKNKLNKGFIWLVLRNIYYDTCKQKSKVTKVSLDQCAEITSEYILESEFKARRTLEDKIDNEIKTWHEYDKLLFRVYSLSTDSMRDIAKGTGINLHSIFGTLKNCKNRLRLECEEDYKDLQNGDFELIK